MHDFLRKEKGEKIELMNQGKETVGWDREEREGKGWIMESRHRERKREGIKSIFLREIKNLP